jgi:hypothetical protein
MGMSLSDQSEIRVRPEINERLKRAMLDISSDHFA